MLRLALLLVLLTSPKTRGPQAVPDAGAAEPFPPGTFAGDESWFAEALRAMGEGRIDKASGTTVRFTWIQAFSHPIVVRAWNVDGHARLRVVELDVADLERAHPVVDRTIDLKPEDWIRLASDFDALGFWQMPTEDPSKKIIIDGAEWVLEASQGGRYHAVERGSSLKSGAGKGSGGLGDLCREMLRLAGIKDQQPY